jgi:epoxyqueuosine reductase QueG
LSSLANPAPDLSASYGAGLTRARAHALALETGFSEAGLVALPYPEEARDASRFERWIGAGRAGTMRYLERAAENGDLVRARVGIPYPWARSALVCFALYANRHPQTMNGFIDRSIDPAPEGAGWIARYAWSSRTDANGKRVASDYHKVLLKRLKVLDARLRAEFGAFDSRAYVDTGPVVERSLAVAAGLGWTGKNTCLIHPQLGSFGFLAVLLTSLRVSEPASQQNSGSAGQPIGRPPATDENEALENLAPKGPPRIAQGGVRRGERNPGKGSQVIPPPQRGGTNSQISSSPGNGFSRADPAAKKSGALAPEENPLLVPDRCGTCTRCIEACPTHALDVPYQMDATRCIAYLTIEHKGPIDENLAAKMGRQVFGCDICQDVCPWNKKAPRNAIVAADPELEPRAELMNPMLEWLASMDEAEFEREFNGSPVRRAGFWGLRRNVAIAMGNSGLPRFAPQLQAWAGAADESLRAAARWALARLRSVKDTKAP